MVSVAEEWRTVPGYDNYAVSREGNVLSCRRGRLLKPIAHRGYLVVKLGHPNAAYGIHQIVAWAFIGPQVNGLVVNHKDGNKHNNEVDNLEYTTNVGNVRHAYDNRLMRNKGELNGRAQLAEGQVREIKFGGMSAREAAARFGVAKHVVWQIRSGKNWKHVEATP